MFGEDCILGEVYGWKETALQEWQSQHAEDFRCCLTYLLSKRPSLLDLEDWQAQIALQDGHLDVSYPIQSFARSEDLRLSLGGVLQILLRNNVDPPRLQHNISKTVIYQCIGMIVDLCYHG